MKILIDMNLSPDWVAAFASQGIESVHWSAVGDPRAEDTEIMAFARMGGYIVFTHDLDFGTMLALTQAESPSIVQIRSEDIFPEHLAETLLPLLRTHEATLQQGALIIADRARSRIRLLPLQRRS